MAAGAPDGGSRLRRRRAPRMAAGAPDGGGSHDRRRAPRPAGTLADRQDSSYKTKTKVAGGGEGGAAVGECRRSCGDRHRRRPILNNSTVLTLY